MRSLIESICSIRSTRLSVKWQSVSIAGLIPNAKASFNARFEGHWHRPELTGLNAAPMERKFGYLCGLVLLVACADSQPLPTPTGVSSVP
jgi:hypothetical protein